MWSPSKGTTQNSKIVGFVITKLERKRNIARPSHRKGVLVIGQNKTTTWHKQYNKYNKHEGPKPKEFSRTNRKTRLQQRC